MKRPGWLRPGDYLTLYADKGVRGGMVLGDARDLPIANGQFGVFFCASLVEHMPEEWQVSLIADSGRLDSRGRFATRQRRCAVKSGLTYLRYPVFMILPFS
jgi:hypothetical protein